MNAELASVDPDAQRSEALLEWFASHGRDLAWRHTHDAWAVLVSEVMLSQTQVTRVVEPFKHFLDRFDDPRSCAEATVGDVVTAWAGLGYNRRAVNLHRCACRIVTDHDGSVPDSLDELLALPGVGPYIARAVLVFAYERDVGVVDTNVARVLARWHGRPLGRAESQRIADELVVDGQAWGWNQALFDLGATICTARNPNCPHCPVAKWCAWAGQGDDPAVGTAGTGSRQSRFAGSDRQGRGRLVDALRNGPVAADPAHLAEAMGWPDDPERATRVAQSLVDDGLAVHNKGTFRLP